MIGYVMLHRDILEWEWYQSSNVSRVFIHLILRANFLDKKWQGMVVKRGQLITSHRHLSIELGLSIQTIRTSLQKLESSGYITKKATNKFSLITLINYDNRQSSTLNSNKQNSLMATNKKQSKNKQVTTTKESNKKKNFNKATIESRKANFKKQVFEHSQFSKTILTAFFDYWTELDKTKTILRFESTHFFEVKKRLKKWVSNEIPKKFNSINRNTNSNR